MLFNLIKTVALGLTGMVVLSCATVTMIEPDIDYTVERSRVFQEPYEEMWQRSVDWFADHNVTIEKIEKPSGLLTARYKLQTSDTYLDCGSYDAIGVSHVRFDRLGSLNLTVREVDENNTAVNVNFFGSYEFVANDVMWGGRIIGDGQCVSTGEMEAEIFEFLSR